MASTAPRSQQRPSHVRPGPPRGGDGQARTRPAGRLDLDGADMPGSLSYRLTLAALRNPVHSGGALISLVAALAIVTNAVGQPERHPTPLFETRPYAIPPAAAGPVTLPQSADPLAQPVPAAKPKPRADAQPVVRDIQSALKERGFYTGTVDGIPGSATTEAIRAFERQIGYKESGEPSERILGVIAQLQAQAIAGAQPPAQPPAQPTAPAQAQPTVAVKTTSLTTPPAPLGRSISPEPLSAGGSERLQRVQRALLAHGYGPLRGDGKMDDRTEAAIKRYELDRGWPVTGKLSDRLVLDAMIAAR